PAWPPPSHAASRQHGTPKPAAQATNRGGAALPRRAYFLFAGGILSLLHLPVVLSGRALHTRPRSIHAGVLFESLLGNAPGLSRARPLEAKAGQGEKPCSPCAETRPRNEWPETNGQKRMGGAGGASPSCEKEPSTSTKTKRADPKARPSRQFSALT